MKVLFLVLLSIFITIGHSTNPSTTGVNRPALLRSASSSMRHYLSLWPDELVVILNREYAETEGFHEGIYFGRSQLISNAIFEQTGKLRSASEVKRKLASMGKPV